MYDSHIGSGTFRRLKGRISQLYYAVNDEDSEDIIEEIQEAYSEGYLSGTQYDNLISEMAELGYYL